MAGTTKARKSTRKAGAGTIPAKVHGVPWLVGKTEDEVHAKLAQHIEGWADLSAVQKREFAELALAHQRAPEPVKVALTKQEDGSTQAQMASKSEALGVLKLQATFAANSIEPVNARANEILSYLRSVGAGQEDRYNAALAFVESMGARDQAEVLLLVQMYCTHDAAIRALSQLGNAEWVPHLQTYGNLATKLLRVSQGQMETLAKMRRGGVQEVRHTHYYVDNRGGQAVFTENVSTGGRKINGSEQPQEPHAADNCAALPSPHPFGDAVPLSSAPGPQTLPPSWRQQSGRAEG